jgi:hypothetical protein
VFQIYDHMSCLPSSEHICLCFIYIICIYLRMLVSNTISKADNIRLVVIRRLPTMKQEIFYPSGAPEFTSVFFVGIRLAQSFFSM